jgi:hypothetical protein
MAENTENAIVSFVYEATVEPSRKIFHLNPTEESRRIRDLQL